jgi:hypothetical protein
MTTTTRGSKEEGRREAIFFFVGPEKKRFRKEKKRGRLEAGLKRAKLKPYLPENGQLLSLSFYPCVNNKCTIVTV